MKLSLKGTKIQYITNARQQGLFLSTFKGSIGSLEKYITTDKWKNNII